MSDCAAPDGLGMLYLVLYVLYSGMLQHALFESSSTHFGHRKSHTSIRTNPRSGELGPQCDFVFAPNYSALRCGVSKHIRKRHKVQVVS